MKGTTQVFVEKECETTDMKEEDDKGNVLKQLSPQNIF